MQTDAITRPIGKGSIHRLVTVMAVLVTSASATAQIAQPPGEAKKKTTDNGPQVVQFTTEDGVSIVADYYAPEVTGKEKAPVAILIHMYPANRMSWSPLVPDLCKAGFAVLAYDIRGTGGSVEPAKMKLKKRYKRRDSELFKAAWQDTAAAKQWLGSQASCDVSRIALIGASIGCSISLDYGSRDEAVKAIVCLSPGTDYFGVDSVEHIKACGERAILLIAPESEYAIVKKLVKASGGVAKGKKYAGGRKQHGTNLFHSDDGKKVKRRILAFLRKVLPAEEQTIKKTPVRPGKKQEKKPRRRSI
jgi:pimeloyl-ACP methyl ester carboxylesterase